MDYDDDCIFKMIADEQSCGKASVFSMYMNLALDQKKAILKDSLNDRLNHHSKEIPFTLGHYSGYLVNFWSVLSNIQMKYCFWKHLKSEKNEHPFEFVLEMLRLEDVVSDHTIAKFDSLVRKYIDHDSMNELNISGTAKKTF